MGVNPANTRFLYISAAVAFFLILALLTHHRDAVFTTSSIAIDSDTSGTSEHIHTQDNPGEKVAYATWYSSTVDEHGEDYHDDVYFIATRMLAYQLLHDPETKTRKNIPFIIMVTPNVSQNRRERLAKDGAIIHPVDYLGKDNEWLTAGRANWVDIMSKLHVYELTEYNRVLLIDGDTVLQSPLDGIFDDPAAQIMTSSKNTSLLKADEAPIPEKYLLGSMNEVKGPDHSFPPLDSDMQRWWYFCAGFFMLHPDKTMFNYLLSVMNIKDRFAPDLMEQNLLNYVHRPEGPMPWSGLNRTWNIRDLNYTDVEKGVVSAHMKWWETPLSHEQKSIDWFHSIRWKMEGYYQAYDEYKKNFPSYQTYRPS